MRKKLQLGLHPSVAPRKCENAQNKESLGFFCGYLVDWWESNKQFGETSKERLNDLNKGGYRITLSLDPDIQATAETQLHIRHRIAIPSHWGPLL